MISVVIPLYNKELVVLKTLETVKKQTFKDYEIVIVNDGSTDKSIELVSQYISDNPNLKIRLIHKPNGGVSSARNLGIEEAQGEYIAFLDADDEWCPEYLSTIQNLIDKYPECDVFGTQYYYKEPSRTYKANIKGFTFDGSDGIIDNYFEMCLCGRPPLWTSAIVTSKKSILHIGKFPIDIAMGEDLVTWAKLACLYKIAYSKKYSSTYTRLPENYETGSYSSNVLPSPKSDKGGDILKALKNKYPKIKGLKRYCFLWHKMRFVMLTHSGRKCEGFIEWMKTLPQGFFNLDCYYRLFLNCLPCKWHSKIKKIVGKE